MNKGGFSLVLSGGSVRAAAHGGVIQAMEEYGLCPQSIVGCSGGSIVGAMYACGMTASQIQDVFLYYRNKKGRLIDINYMEAIIALLHRDIGRFTGFIHGNSLRKVVGSHLRDVNTFQELLSRRRMDPVKYKDLYIIAINLLDGAQTIFNNKYRTGKLNGYRVCNEIKIDEAVRASSSIPGIFRPFACKKDRAKMESCTICNRNIKSRNLRKRSSIQVEYYIDGGVRDYYPITTAVKLTGAQQIFGVNLGYEGLRRTHVINGGIPEILSQTLDIYEMDQYASALSDKDIHGKAIVTLNPEIYDVSTFEVERSAELIKRGYNKAVDLFNSKGLVKGKENGTKNETRLFS